MRRLNPEAPAFTPLRPEAAEFIPTMPDGIFGSWDLQRNLVATFEEVSQLKQKRQFVRQMPPASEEEWETRTSKREKEVATIKALPSYRLYVEVFPPGKRAEEDPDTPDPRDRTISKRMWKWNVEKWRLLLKSRCIYSRSFALQTREYILSKEREAEPTDIGGVEVFVPGVLKTLKSSRLQALSAEAPSQSSSRIFHSWSSCDKTSVGKFQ